VKAEPFYVAIITPVIHYCMGGLEIDVDSAVVGGDGKAIPGLYAAGEVAGGVHGNNRLGGNSLLDCVVFGRVAGRACAAYMLGGGARETSLKALAQLPVLKKAQADPPGGKAAAPAAAAAPGAPKDKTKRTSYKPEKWGRHLRGFTMGQWSRMDERRRRAAEAAAASAAEAAALEAGRSEAAALMAEKIAQRAPLERHYFPLPSERAQPVRAQLRRSAADWLGSYSDTDRRKVAFVLALLASAILAKLVIHWTPHE